MNTYRDTLGGYKTIDEYVKAKLDLLHSREPSFEFLYELMFRERDNILLEESRGYSVIRTTYGECRDSIDRRAASLKAMLGNLPPHSYIGLAAENGREWMELLWCILRAGHRPLLLNRRLGHVILEGILEDIGAVCVLSDKETYRVRTIRTEEVLPAAEPLPLSEGSMGDEIDVMSSGTSSHVKVCAYGVREIICQIEDSGRIINDCGAMKQHYDGMLKQLTFLPFCHIFGLTAVYLWFAFFSRTFVLLKDMQPQTILNTIRRHKVTHIFAVPMLWKRVYEEAMRTVRERGEKDMKKLEKGIALYKKLSSCEFLARAFSKIFMKEVRDNLFGESISFLISGGSEISREVLTFFNAIGYHLANGYGMTEVGITSVELSNSGAVRNTGSVGKPFRSVEYRVMDGILEVRSAAMARTVWQGGKFTDTAGKWFATGDLAQIKDGRCYILGRKDDLVIAPSGENLNPNLVEPQLLIPGVRQVCLTSVRRADGIMPVLLVSVPFSMPRERMEALREAMKERLAERQLTSLIGTVVFTAHDLMGDDFKLNRRRIAQDYEYGKIRPFDWEGGGNSEGMNEALSRRVREIFASAVGCEPREITDSTDFFLDCGGTSLDYLSMAARLQEEFPITFPSDGSKTLSTVKDLVKLIEGAIR